MTARDGDARPVTASASARARAWVRGKVWDDWIETVTVLLLATASLAAAWSGYQASKWSGEQSALYSQAFTRRVQATQASNNAYLYTIMDIETFNHFATAYDQNNARLMAFHERQFSDRLRPAADAWIATDPLNNPDAPSSPFEMQEYVVPERERSLQLEAETETLFAEGGYANEQSDNYVLNTVILAMVLFFGGIVTKVRGRPARTVIIALGCVLLLYGIYHVVSLPVEGGGR